ncbi:MAG TPA: DMT family transporter [Clostridiaceae bacterium]|nr:DMT family transporter [Clostridiaceae bacterium]
MMTKFKADVSLLLITIVWGSSFVLVKNVLEFIPSFAYISVRFILAGAVLVILFHKRLGSMSRKTVLYGFILSLMLFGGVALQIVGLYYTTASNSAFITGLSVVMVPVISVLALRKKPGINSVIGVILAFTGLFFLSGGLNFKFNIGDFLTLLCAICFALQIILLDKFTGDQDPMLLSILQISFTGVYSTVIWIATGFKPFTINTDVILTLFITGVLGSAVAYSVQAVVQKHTTPTHAALIMTAEPVFGAIFALIIPDAQGNVEALNMNEIAGCVLILLGMLISEAKISNVMLKREANVREIIPASNVKVRE